MSLACSALGGHPDGVSAFYYDYFNPGESSPDYLGVSGGNKYARCSHGSTLISGQPELDLSALLDDLRRQT